MEHWAELPKSNWRVGGVRIWAKKSRPWWRQPVKQFTWANGSSPVLTEPGRKQHRTKLGPWNVDGCCITGADWRATGSGTRIPPYCLYWLLVTHWLWRDTLFSLDIVERTLVLIKEVCLTFSEKYCLGWADSGRDSRSGGSGNLDWYVKWKR